VSNKNFSPEFWLQQFYLDPEMELHTIELYKIWYEKKEFVRKAIEMNPFNHTKFLWTDAGIIRNADAPYMMRGYPNVRKIPDDKMLVLCVEPFHDDDGVDFAKLDRLAGGVIAGSVNVWNEWLDLYGDVVNRYAEEKLFIGKEQNVINAMYIERKDLFELLQKRESGAFDKWRYILRYLGS
jgi:hypothetical protein